MRGGFAAALRAGPSQGGTLLRELLRDVGHRDIVTRHSLRTAKPLMTLALHLLAHPGQPLSWQALSKGLGLPSVANWRTPCCLPCAAPERPRPLPARLMKMWVITLDQEDTLIEQGRSVRILPGWKWLD